MVSSGPSATSDEVRLLYNATGADWLAYRTMGGVVPSTAGNDLPSYLLLPPGFV